MAFDFARMSMNGGDEMTQIRKTKPVHSHFMVVLLLTLSIFTGRGFAQSSTPREETWVTNGPVNAIACTTDTVYIGGEFSYVGPCTGGGVPIDTGTGKPVGTFPKVNGHVYASVPDGSGGWYIGGDFVQVGAYIAHILPDGTVDSAWQPSVSVDTGYYTPLVYTLALSGSRLYVGGRWILVDRGVHLRQQ